MVDAIYGSELAGLRCGSASTGVQAPEKIEVKLN